jgi:ketosteroid isomerase-like protein
MRLLIAILAVLPFAAPAAAQTADDVNGSIEAVLGDHTKFEAAFDALQTAVADEDAEAVAALVAYPLVVKVGERREIAAPEEFVAAYDEIMTEEITTTISEQSYETLFVNGDGIMFGNGEVWMSGVCEDDACEVWDVKIITIQSTDG